MHTNTHILTHTTLWIGHRHRYSAVISRPLHCAYAGIVGAMSRSVIYANSEKIFLVQNGYIAW